LSTTTPVINLHGKPSKKERQAIGTQLIRRIQRKDDAQSVIRIHDFVDAEVLVFAHMARSRHGVIVKKGFKIIVTDGDHSQPALDTL
jgi:hypothetical protein